MPGGSLDSQSRRVLSAIASRKEKEADPKARLSPFNALN